MSTHWTLIGDLRKILIHQSPNQWSEQPPNKRYSYFTTQNMTTSMYSSSKKWTLKFDKKKPYWGFLSLYQCPHIGFCNWGSQADLKTQTQINECDSLLIRDTAVTPQKVWRHQCIRHLKFFGKAYMNYMQGYTSCNLMGPTYVLL